MPLLLLKTPKIIIESTHSVPILKTPRKPMTQDDRLKCETLYFKAGWTYVQIALQLNLTSSQVQYALLHRLTLQKQRYCGRKAILNTPQRKRLIEWVTFSKKTRRTLWADIPPILGFNCGLYIIRTAFKKEGYARRIVRQKPPFTYANKIQQLQ